MATKPSETIAQPIQTDSIQFNNISQGIQKSEEFDDARNYLEKHKILDVIQQLTVQLLIEKPNDPKEFMVRKLENMRVARVSTIFFLF